MMLNVCCFRKKLIFALLTGLGSATLCYLSVSYLCLLGICFLQDSNADLFGTTSQPDPNQLRKTSILDCVLPEVDPWEPADAIYFGHPIIKQCTPKNVGKSKLENGKLWINIENIIEKCYYQCLNYNTDKTSNPGSWILYPEPGPASVYCDWVYVSCIKKQWFKKTHYRQVHSQIYVPAALRPSFKSNKKRYNVYVLGIDTISNGQFHRTMPKTAFFLENELRGINFKYLSKVGENSFPNHMAALFGQRYTTEPHQPQGYPVFNSTTSGSCRRSLSKTEPFIEFIYNDQGFRTAHIEDTMPIVMNYPECEGFNFKSSNHSTVPLFGALKNKKISTSVLYISCKKQFQLAMEFFKNYITAATPEPKFTYSIMTGPAHDGLNHPYQHDDYFYRWLKGIKEKLDDAFLLVWSDHGHHFSSFTTTFRGQTDTRNPTLTIVLPKNLRENLSHPIVQNLWKNSRTLVSQYDIFPTLVDLATANFNSPVTFLKHLSSNDYGKLNKRIKTVQGDSLLRPLTHRKPTCAGLGIPFTFCICQWPNFTPRDIKELKKRVINDIPPLLNGFLKERGAEEQCIKIEVDTNYSINITEVSAKLVKPSTRLIRAQFNVKNQQHSPRPDIEVYFEILGNGTLSLAGRVLALNFIPKEKRCRSDEYEQQICICKNQNHN